MPRHVPAIRVALALAGALTVVACVGATGSGSPGASDGSPAEAPSPSRSPAAIATAPAQDAPPDARLAADGGDPVSGQLGTYTWRDGGSDAPWLPGAPILVGAGEPLTVTFEPPAPIAAWTAVYIPADADGPAGARPLDDGRGTPAFQAPDPGAWTVDLEVTFADGLGSAHYAWRLDVS